MAGALTGFLKKKKNPYYNRKMSKEFNDAKIPEISININGIDIDKCWYMIRLAFVKKSPKFHGLLQKQWKWFFFSFGSKFYKLVNFPTPFKKN